MATKAIQLTDEDRVEILASSVSEKLKRKMTRANTKIKPSSAKGKGRNFQYWVCEQLSSLLNVPYLQSDDSCDIHSREMGQHGKDIVLRGRAKDLFPFSIECKNCENLSLADVVAQASHNSTEEEPYLILHKRKTIPSPIVIMAWDTFANLYKKVMR
jgi:hypothetical protein